MIVWGSGIPQWYSMYGVEAAAGRSSISTFGNGAVPTIELPAGMFASLNVETSRNLGS